MRGWGWGGWGCKAEGNGLNLLYMQPALQNNLEIYTKIWRLSWRGEKTIRPMVALLKKYMFKHLLFKKYTLQKLIVTKIACS